MPAPGMMPYDDVHFQLVDMPAVSPEHPVPWLSNTLQTADAALLVVDLDEPSCVEQLQGVHATLHTKHVTLTERWDKDNDPVHREEPGDGDPFSLRLPTLVLANKCDRASDPDASLDALRDLAQMPYPAFAVSAVTGHGLGEIAPW